MRHPSLIPLSHDHHHGLALALRCRKQALGQVKPMGAAGLRQRADEVLEFFRANLAAHFRAEEEVLFPYLRYAAPEGTAMIEELIGDHQVMRQYLPRLEADSDLAKAVFDFGDLLERHIRKEERELFPLYEKTVDGPKAAEIGAAMKEILNANIGERMEDEG